MRPAASVGAADAAVRGQANAVYSRMAKAAERFEKDWGELPNTKLDTGSDLKLGSRGERVAQLRSRLGLGDGDLFDAQTKRVVALYRAAHGLSKGIVVDGEMIASLNRGHSYYKRLIDLNLARIAALPADLGERYILVDAAEQKLYMYADGKVEDTMRVVVGKEAQPTPMMAGMIRYAVVNPYWNIPPDLVRDNVAAKVLDQGRDYWDRNGFEALDGWSDDAKVLKFSDIDWKAVAAGDFDLRVRQKPGPMNGMGQIKFMFPNQHGVYLHDTPSKSLFEEGERLFSAGCVRVQNPWGLAEWLFGERPDSDKAGPESEVQLETPVPVYITYLTAVPNSYGFEFREDFYRRDTPALAYR